MRGGVAGAGTRGQAEMVVVGQLNMALSEFLYTDQMLTYSFSFHSLCCSLLHVHLLLLVRLLPPPQAGSAQ